MSADTPRQLDGRSGRSRRTGRRPIRDIARGVCRRGRVLVLAACAVAPLACGAPVPSSSPTPPSSATGPWLTVLDVTPDRATIAAYQPDGVARPISAPPGELQWLAADARGGLVATRLDGAVVHTVAHATAPATTTGPPATDIVWANVRFPGPTGGPPLSFAVPDPAGDRFVALSAAYGTGAPSFLTIADGTPVVSLGIEANGAAPAWLDDRRVIVAGLGAGMAPATVIVDVRTGRSSPGPTGVRAIAVSADGARVATVGRDQRTVEVWATIAWAGSGARAVPPAPVRPEPRGVVTALALDGSGRSLAVVWTGPDLLPAVVVRYEDVGGWRERGRIALRAGTVRAAVAWQLAPGATP